MEHCKDCGLKLRGRTDKKFCGDHCRSHYNNELNKERYNLTREISGILKKNTAILKKLNVHGIEEVTHNRLLSSGFNFEFFTHQIFITGTGQVYNCCYSYGYCEIAREKYILKDISTCLNL